MRQKFYIVTISLFFLFAFTTSAQEFSAQKVVKAVGFDVSPELRSVQPVTPSYIDRSWKDKVIPNKDGFQEEFKTESLWNGPDPVLQDYSSSSREMANIDKNFDGLNNTSGIAPPDTQGDVSNNYYFQMVNLSFRIWDKNGNSVYGPAANSTLWNGFQGPWTGTNDGDPIVLYDQFADRWIATQFSMPNYPSGPFYELVAVSATNNPTGAWYRYAFEFANMPDYPKFGVWADGYYFTINQFAPPNLNFAGGAICVLNRNAMLQGDPNAQMVFFNMGTSFGSLLPADADGSLQPLPGNYIANLGSNALRIWKTNVNWSNPQSSSVSLVSTLTTQPYSYSGITINQPGTTQTLDPLASRLMYRLQYRKFPTYEAMVTNHTVNANGTGRAGVRWYELRNTGSGWFIYQQGTYAPADGNNRWMASIAMNGNGDIALGYSVSGTNTFPSIRVTGQTASNSGSGIMNISETQILAGTKAQTGVNRWGDYSMMSVDPTNDANFWFTTEYSNGGWNWKTRIASFNLGTSTIMAPVADFAANNCNVVTGSNVQFNDLSINNPTSWQWSFPGGVANSITTQSPVVTYNTPGTYNVALTVSNAAGTHTKTVNSYITVTNPLPVGYCQSNSLNSSPDFIANVKVGAVSYPSGATTYSDFTNKSFNMTRGTSSSIVLTPGSTTRKEFWRIWIDYNNDGDFDDANELVYSANNRKGNATGTIVVPTNVTTGQKRMRVTCKFGSAPGSCEIFTSGEVEDYTVNIIEGSLAPTISKSETNFALNVYPNPARDVVNIKLTTESAKINVKLYNSLGVILNDFDINEKEAAINVGTLPKGLYYIGVDDGKQTALRKFIKE